MQNQEAFQQSDLEGFSTTPPSTTTTTTTATTLFSDRHCTTCSNSMKRRSSSPPSLFDTIKPNSDSFEPKSKKLMMVQEDDLSIPFPGNVFPSSSPILRRCFSDPYSSPGTTPPDSAVKVVGPSPTRGNSSLPPRPPVLHRTLSTPAPSASLIPAVGMAPGRSNSGLPSSGDWGVSLPLDAVKEESPNSKRLTRMKDRMREMNQWLGEVMREGENDASDDNNSNAGQDAFGDEADEEVSVEKLGECLSVNFRCPCGKGCQILLNGRHCYYKLI